ncbi:hypothetical protein [Heliophilum fasciatum]|uniref:Uncharacterized protein n=1 Tax=Heliophilum fasciatum TaxID=35700 RepID=A0A4V2SW07_9FIRM|nr:hypothetical protein [Heliophilum fasciatum]MCW2279295.1 hypothetical protein [Heliophilum fasciatum]TCP60456.1 hypothetical protein EDD73_13716 [Heliophilum fasciatum]
MTGKQKKPYADRFQQGSDYKKAFEEDVNLLIKRDMPLPWRNKAVEELTEAYLEQIGQIPDSLQLHRLANYILRDELKDRCPDKLTRTEFPFLSSGQVSVRMRRERATGDMSYFSSTNKRNSHKPKKYRHSQQQGA